MVPANLISALFLPESQTVQQILSSTTGTTLLVKIRGEAGTSSNLVITDSGPLGLPVTNVNNNAVSCSFSPYGAYGSVSFDSVSSKLSTGNLGVTNPFSFGTGDFTVECYINYVHTASTGGGTIIDTRLSIPITNKWALHVHPTTRKLEFFVASSSILQSQHAVSRHKWTHVAVSRSLSVLRIFIDGVLSASAANTLQLDSHPGAEIGANYTGSSYFNGQISNLRVVNGTALYVQDFVPPSTALTIVPNTSFLALQQAQFISSVGNGREVFSVSGSPKILADSPVSVDVDSGFGSISFAPSKVLSATSNELTIGNSDFLIEFWVYATSTNNNQIFFDMGSGYDSYGPQIGLYYNTLRYSKGGNAPHEVVGGAVPRFHWNHIALVKVSGETRLWLNGVQQGPTSTTTSFTPMPMNVMVGSENDSSGGAVFTGYIADVHISIGVNPNAYVSTFTPPRAPITPVSATKFLLRGNDARVVDIGSGAAISGAAMLAMEGSRSGRGCLVFNRDRVLTIPYSNSLYLPGDFTIECWACPEPRSSNYNCLVSNYSGGAAQNGGFHIATDSVTYPSKHSFFAYLDTMVTLVSTSDVVYGQWVHLAVVRHSGIIRLFVNGIEEASSAAGSSIPIKGTMTAWYIGSLYNILTTGGYTGKIEDLQVTKGRAKYTSNFVPQSLPA